MDIQRLKGQMLAGDIKRYHTFSIIGSQTVGAHSYGVAQILRYLTNDKLSCTLLMAALDHDVAEMATGDIPHVAKRGNESLRLAVNVLEAEFEKVLGIDHSLTKDEQKLLKMADLFEMLIFGVDQLLLGNRGGAVIIENILEVLQPSPTNERAVALLNDIKMRIPNE